LKTIFFKVCKKMETLEQIKNDYIFLISEHPNNWGLTETATDEEIEEMALSLAIEEKENKMI